MTNQMSLKKEQKYNDYIEIKVSGHNLSILRMDLHVDS